MVGRGRGASYKGRAASLQAIGAHLPVLFRPVKGPLPLPDTAEAPRPASSWRDFCAAIQFLTRIPVSSGEVFDPTQPGRSMRFYPLVGGLIGLIGGAVHAGGLWVGLPPLTAALLAILGTILLTGALHEDGLADCADGFGGGRDRDSILRIMRDHVLGSFGVLALILSVGLRASAVSSFGWQDGFFVLVAAHSFSRGLMPLIATMPPARSDGLGAFYARPPALAVWQSVLIAVVILALAVTPLEALIAGGAAAFAMRLIAVIAHRRIGGFTGDVCGAAQQLAETVILLALVALW